ncbi:MAG: chemotaxis protein CheW [Nitrospirota bacterium]|nr:chemotaxis protein CheW [Nitrospirota bacterium]
MDIAKIRKKARPKKQKNGPQEASPEQAAGAETIAATASGEEVEGTRKGTVSADGASGDEASDEVREGDGPEEITPAEAQAPACLELLIVSLAKEEFAFRISEVEEIIRYQKITKIPTMPDYVLGITSLRGKIIPVIDMKIRLGLEGETAGGGDAGDQTVEMEKIEEIESNEKIVIVSGPLGLIGATVDKVSAAVRFPVNKTLDPPAHLTEGELKFIEGVVIYEKRFISIIRSKDTMNIDAC